ncbi:hypothetical protein ABEB36_011465 [Hypothenemus hampei]|uniref:PARP16 N-terminal domain-containing protein n=1 Tax=Hypothenemus hampei TaxID=57062 RepID=A0ABD1EFI1_HYPHA
METDKRDFFKSEEQEQVQEIERCTVKSKESLEELECSTVEKLKSFLRENKDGCDFLICIFIAAVKSVRVDQVLRPFPSTFVNSRNEKDFTLLRRVCDKITTVDELLKLSPNNIPKDVVDILTWLFFHSGMPLLKLHSLEVLFGNGIYLSSEISISAHYAPFGETWQNSIFGSHHSIIAVCEVVNDTQDVKCKDDENKQRAINKNSLGKIPEKYFVVTNSELVKVKYLLVYRYKGPSVLKSFLKQNFLWILLILYVFMLLLIRFFNGPGMKLSEHISSLLYD